MDVFSNGDSNGDMFLDMEEFKTMYMSLAPDDTIEMVKHAWL